MGVSPRIPIHVAPATLDGTEDFVAHAQAGYGLEPCIHKCGRFSSSRGLRVLELGVGMGADCLEWLKAGARATGVESSPCSQARGYVRIMLYHQSLPLRA